MNKGGTKNNMLREKRKHANYKPNRRLDAKSSRGMIYENEELRIRTININAEVERGQSEIKTLKREREQLRREIWTLRDEYDKLENLLRIKGIDPDEFLNQNKNDNNEEMADDASEGSECSCESCCGEEDYEHDKSDDQACQSSDNNSNKINSKDSATKSETSPSTSSLKSDQQPHSSKNSNDDHSKRQGKDRLNLNFDHLSVVSEENSEGNSLSQTDDSIPMQDLSTYINKVDVLSPLSYLQTLAPPLSHFENLQYDQIGDTHNEQINKDAQALTQQIHAPILVSSIKATIQPSTSAAPVKKESRLKHFFSPIRKKSVCPVPVMPPVPPVISQPDVFISNILPSNLYVNQTLQMSNVQPRTNQIESAMAKITQPVEPTSSSPTSSFQTGGNLEELLFDIEALSKDIMELQTQCATPPAEQVNQSKKPFRSELNLVLSYPGALPPAPAIESPSALPLPMELLTPTMQINPLLLSNLPSPFPSNSAIPQSPITPPTNFKALEDLPFENPPDYTNLQFAPLNAALPIFASNNSVFCTVSAPSTPASDRKCIDKFFINESIVSDKKKAKRVSIVNSTKDDSVEKANDAAEPVAGESKETDDKDKTKTDANGTTGIHHGHLHKSHVHGHIHPKRRMSLDNTVQNSTRHKNHRTVSQDPNAKVTRRESNRSSNSFKKRSRSESTFGHGPEYEQGGTSVSERYSNSLASSRESSTSLSLKSHGKRRISITSYGTSKKIPWCGCWGNSCI